jgi:glycine cleavage system H protein
MSIPQALKYTPEHEWLDIDRDEATVGITAYAADALGDVVYLDLPAVGSILIAGDVCGEIESTKSVSDLYAPADGVVLTINGDAVEEPSVLNLDPYQSGWLFRMRLSNNPPVLDAIDYELLTSGE